MDDQWLGQAIAWALDRIGPVPALAQAREDVRGRDWGIKARASVALARDSFATEHGRKAARWQLANSCRTFSTEAADRGDAQEQQDWLVIACLLYADLAAADPKYGPSLQWCSARLQELGVTDWHAADPVGRDVGGTSATDSLDDLFAASMELDGSNKHGVVVAERAVAAAGAVNGDTILQGLDLPSGIDVEANLDHDLAALVSTWHGPLRLADTFDAFNAFIVQELDEFPAVRAAIEATVREDLAELEEHVGDAAISHVGDDVLDLARQARQLATARGVTPRTEPFIRRRWLLAGALNHALLTKLDWETNRHQVVVDLLGYVTAVQIARRFSDEQRELLLASHELVVQVGSMLPKAFHRFPYIRNWITSAFGTYLLLAGPDPTTPSESLTDERIIGERRTPTAPDRGIYEPGREDRVRWAQRLLERWRYEREQQPSAAFAVASVAGWDPAVIERLMAMVFPEPTGEDAEDRAYWLDEASSIIGRAKPVRVASNPWAPGERRRNASSLVTSDRLGRLCVPDAVLRAMVSEITESDWSVTVQGEIFRGRRMPTYLLINQYGPFGVLKLDYRDRVQRELKNFERFARKRLRPQNRPSECRAGDFRLYVGKEDEPLQAILTSYVFDEDERPATLALWLRDHAKPGQVGALLEEQLADRVMFPWLSHVRRDNIDLRMAYPLLRPRRGEHNEHAPQLWAETELRKLRHEEVVQTLGFEIGTSRAFRDEAAHIAANCGIDTPDDAASLVNPLWLIAELAELGSGAYDDKLYGVCAPLSASNTLLFVNHGDLHADNILCTNLDRDIPSPVLIDFETTHETHLCRDFARLEASLMCQVFDWEPEQASMLSQWFVRTLDEGECVYQPPSLDGGDVQTSLVAEAVVTLRGVLGSLGPTRWPLSLVEHALALVAALTPMARYTNAMSVRQRSFGLLLAARVATRLDTALQEA